MLLQGLLLVGGLGAGLLLGFFGLLGLFALELLFLLFLGLVVHFAVGGLVGVGSGAGGLVFEVHCDGREDEGGRLTAWWGQAGSWERAWEEI